MADLLVPCAEVSPVAVGLDPGSLLDWNVALQVGIVLSEIPSVRERNQIAHLLLRKNNTYWENRAAYQVQFGQYRKQFNIAFTSGGAGPGGQLPIPPANIIKYTFTGPAYRTLVNGIDMIVRNYTAHAVVVTDYVSPKLSDPALATLGGVAHVVVDLPIDPFEFTPRTYSACYAEQNYAIDTSDLTSHSWDDCIPQAMFVDYCTADFARPLNATEHECNYCHCTFPRPILDCTVALDQFTGRYTADYTFTALAWNATLAAQWTYEPVGQPFAGSNLIPLPSDGKDTNEVYRYVPCGTAEDTEGMVEQCGWSIVNMYDSADMNNGRRPMHIGEVQFHFDENDEPTYPFLHNGEYIYQKLHGHGHFYSYVESNVTDANGTVWQGHEKLGFCVVSVGRAVNAIWSPLYNPYWNCTYQGIAPGWFDVYQRGIPGQWKDSTRYAKGMGQRRSIVNFAAQLCEGTNLCYANGTAAVDPVSTVVSCAPGFTDPVTNSTPWCVPAYRDMCSHLANETEAMTLADNVDLAPMYHHGCGESYVTDTDSVYGRDQEIGPLRDSGMSLIENKQLRYCTPSNASSITKVTIACSIPRGNGRDDSEIFDDWSCNSSQPLGPGSVPRHPQNSEVIRVCESSRKLGCATACRAREAIANFVVSPGPKEDSFIFNCPASRDPVEIGGAYSLYRGALAETLRNQQGGIATCRVVSETIIPVVSKRNLKSI